MIITTTVPELIEDLVIHIFDGIGINLLSECLQFLCIVQTSRSGCSSVFVNECVLCLPEDVLLVGLLHLGKVCEHALWRLQCVGQILE